MTKLFGTDWAQTNIIPKVLALQTHQCYLHRLTTLFTINELVPIVGVDVNTNVFLPNILKMIQDKVPNVRFNVSLTLQGLLPFLDKGTIQTKVKPCLLQLSTDTDNDVLYYTQQTLNKMK